MFSSNVKGKNMCVHSGCHFFSDCELRDLTYINLFARELLHLKADKISKDSPAIRANYWINQCTTMVFHIRFVKCEKTWEKHFNPLLPYLRI